MTGDGERERDGEREYQPRGWSRPHRFHERRGVDDDESEGGSGGRNDGGCVEPYLLTEESLARNVGGTTLRTLAGAAPLGPLGTPLRCDIEDSGISNGVVTGLGGSLALAGAGRIVLLFCHGTGGRDD